MMLDIILILSVVGIGVIGWFAMKRMDAFMAHNMRETHKAVQEEGDALRIAFSSPTAVGSFSRPLELVCQAHPQMGIYLYTADIDNILARLRDGRLDAAIIPDAMAKNMLSGYGTERILVKRSPAMVKDNAMELCPPETEKVMQRLVWAKGACHGAADDFAAKITQDLYWQAGKAYWEGV